MDKQLEKIRKLRSKGNLEKAWKFIEILLKQGERSLEIQVEALAVIFALDNWLAVHTQLKSSLRFFALGQLCCDENRLPFTNCVLEYPGFRSALLEHLLSTGNLRAINEWIGLHEPHDQRWLTETWLGSVDQTGDLGKQAALKMAAGIGMSAMGSWEDAWHQWLEAVRMNKDLLRAIMAYCRNVAGLNTAELRNRLWLVRLILAVGKRNEAFKLLLAMGKESPDNAFKILVEVPSILPGDQSMEVSQLKLNLALFLEDSEILENVIWEMKELPENDLFQIKKHALAHIASAELRRTALLSFGRIYLHQGDWENAAHLFEGLYAENPSADVVVLMEQVLDNYPILPSLHLKVGKYFVETGDWPRARRSLVAIKEVGEFAEPLRHLLEQLLAKNFDADPALMLFDLCDRGSNRAGLLAWAIVHQGAEPDPEFLDRIAAWKPQDVPSPMWLLALAHGFAKYAQMDQLYSYVVHFLRIYPELSAEVWQFAELLHRSYGGDFQELFQIVAAQRENMAPAMAWAALLNQTPHYQTVALDSGLDGDPIPEPNVAADREAPPVTTERQVSRQPPTAAEPLSAPLTVPFESFVSVEDDPELSAFLDRFQHLIASANWPAAAQMATAAATHAPAWRSVILDRLSHLSKYQPQEPVWRCALIEILNQSGRFEAAAASADEMLAMADFQPTPALYFHVAVANQALGREEIAFRYYALAAREKEFYAQSITPLLDLLFPRHSRHLQEVLQLILNQEDRETWDRALMAWYDFRPRELELVINSQLRFAQQTGQARAHLGLAYWYLQAGRSEDADQVLTGLEQDGTGVHNDLTQMAELMKLKDPSDPKPRFLLARLALVHGEILKAVDGFRDLVATHPETAEHVFQFLRAFVKKQASPAHFVKLYGLMIRLALDFQYFLAAVKLLDEYGQINREKAISLADGAARILFEHRDKHLEALFQYGELLFRWGEAGRLLALEEEVDFGTVMAPNRLHWLEAAKGSPEHRDRALVAEAKLCFVNKDFERCRTALGAIRDTQVRIGGLEIYESLTQRFPEDLDLWREVGWTAAHLSIARARPFFEVLFKNPDTQPLHRLEAFAILKEAGAAVDFEKVRAGFDRDINLVYRELREVYCRIQEIELEHWARGGTEVPFHALSWLIASGDTGRYMNLVHGRIQVEDPRWAKLEAKALLARGDREMASWYIRCLDLPVEERQSFLFDLGLVHAAAGLIRPGQRLSGFIRRAFLREAGKPSIIHARFHQLRRLANPIETVPVGTEAVATADLSPVLDTAIQSPQ